jgi:hypothetical protein
MNTKTAKLSSIPVSGSIKIRNTTYTWKRFDHSRMMITRDNFGNWGTELYVEVGLPPVFSYANEKDWDIAVGETIKGGAVIEYDSRYIDQFENLFEWFAENFSSNPEES